LPEDAFWDMSLREFQRYLDGFNRRRDYERQLHFQVAAVQVSELLNAFGDPKPPLQPSRFLDAWLGRETDVESAKQRLARANARHEARLVREAAKRKKRDADSSP